MKELYDFSFSVVNVIPTLILVIVILYWITVFIGLLDVSSLDFEVDMDVDAGVDVDIDVHADADIDGDVGHAGGPNFFVKTLSFFNLGKVPFMIFLSALSLPLWLISIYFNYYFQISSFGASLLFFFPILIVSLFFAKIFTQPLAGVFKRMDEETGTIEDFIGKIAHIRISTDEKSVGQIELENRGATIVLHARSSEGVLEEGVSVLIIDYLENENIYIVEPFNSI